MKINLPLPLPTRRALKKLGSDIRTIRIKLNMSMEDLAKEADISRTTLSKIEKGNANVAIGIYAIVLFILGFTKNLGELINLSEEEKEKFVRKRAGKKTIRKRGKRK